MADPPPAPAQPGALMFEAARQLELSKIPLFFGDPTKDHFTPETWLGRLEHARAIGQWNDNQTAIYMNMSFRENAIKWRDGLRDMGLNTDDWDILRGAFLRFYAPSANIRSCVASLDLKQGSTETVRDYGPRVAKVIHDIRQTLPVYQHPLQLHAPEINALEGYNDLALAIRQQDHMNHVLIGEQRIIDLMSIHIFVAGLKTYLRDKCVTRVFNTYYEAYMFATQLEHNMSDPKKSAHITEIEEDTEKDPEGEISELEQQICNLRFKQRSLRDRMSSKMRNSGSYRGNSNNNRGSNQKRDFSAYTCRYCHIKGHIQTQCRKRIAAGAPLVDNKGGPMKQVRELEFDTDGSTTSAPTGAPTSAPTGSFNPFLAQIDNNNPHLNFY